MSQNKKYIPAQSEIWSEDNENVHARLHIWHGCRPKAMESADGITSKKLIDNLTDDTRIRTWAPERM